MGNDSLVGMVALGYLTTLQNKAEAVYLHSFRDFGYKYCRWFVNLFEYVSSKKSRFQFL
jgi:hypothetical protein